MFKKKYNRQKRPCTLYLNLPLQTLLEVSLGIRITRISSKTHLESPLGIAPAIFQELLWS